MMRDILDSMVQAWASKQRSYVSWRKAECGHHFYSRANTLLRWDLRNIIPLTYEEHTLHHAGKLPIKLPDDLAKTLLTLKLVSYRTYLVSNGWTEEEFMDQQYRKLKEALND